ncbi:WAT1-related protein At3g28050-like isoform X1 [Eucalyptus grandis]|uniref:WAT1-related protein At3g28050-like isoform X1 n=1 Tax=Eucalyptus grandis TaxID=71139 RepID=UPI00192EFA90|nr:WAT1-related protein At3g28050-like isoform X1 [Eucalyptus grandis]
MEMEGRAGGSLPFVGMIMVVLVQASSMVVAKMANVRRAQQVHLGLLLSGSRPPLTFCVLRKIFLLALVGSASQICGYAGIDYSSPVLGTAMMNLIPAFTFILAVISRMEKVNWKSSSSQAKLVGTVASILGALVITVYKGPTVLRSPSLPSLSIPVTLSLFSHDN